MEHMELREQKIPLTLFDDLHYISHYRGWQMPSNEDNVFRCYLSEPMTFDHGRFC